MQNCEFEAKRVSLERNGKSIFSDISFQLMPGDCLQITGKNGSGKTSLLRSLSGLGLKTSGKILWQGNNIETDRDDYAKDLIYIGHNNGIHAGLTAEENLQLALDLNRNHNGLSISDALNKIGIAALAKSYCDELSAGQKRRVALAKLLLLDAKLWLLDEPFTALDRQTVAMLEECIAQHIAKQGMAIVATHQPLNTQKITVKDIVL